MVGGRYFRDTWSLATERAGEGLNTYHDFGSRVRGDNERIDWILIRGVAQVQRVEIVTWQKGGRYPSDHFPVAAWLTLGSRSQDPAAGAGH